MQKENKRTAIIDILMGAILLTGFFLTRVTGNLGYFALLGAFGITVLVFRSIRGNNIVKKEK